MTDGVNPTAAIEPFWQRLPTIFAYGLKPASLATMGAIALGMAVSAMMPGIIGMIGVLVVLSTLYKLCFEVLHATASGRMEPPESALGRFSGGIFWKQLGLWMVLLLFLIQVFGNFPLLVALAAALAIAISLPAMTMILAFDQSLIAALNPQTITAIIQRIGKPYALLCLLLAMLMVSYSLGSALAVALLGGFFGTLVSGCLNVYFMVVMFHLMGYVVYQFHEELGLEPDEEGVGEVQRDEPDHPALGQARALIEEGNPDQARSLLADAVALRGTTLAVSLAYHDMLRDENHRGTRVRHAHQLVAQLLNADRDNEALGIVRDAVSLDPEFQITDGDWASRLGMLALSTGDHAITMHLFKDFARRFPNHPGIPDVYLTIARILSEREGKDAEALDLMQRLKKTFPSHPKTPAIDAYLAQLENLVKSNQR